MKHILKAYFVKMLSKIFKVTVTRVLLFLGITTIILLFFLSEKSQKLQLPDIQMKRSVYPLIVWWSSSFPGTNEVQTCGKNLCEIRSNKNLSQVYLTDAFLFYGSDLNFDNLPERPSSKLIWGLYHEESPRNVLELSHEPALKLFNFTATFSTFSNVPFPLQYLENLNSITLLEYYVPTKQKNEQLNKLAPVLYIQSDCDTPTERDDYVRELMKYIPVDSYGKCLNNKKLPEEFQNDYLNKLNDKPFLHFVAQYKFVIAIENGVCDDYITEKLWRAIKVGSVPIYFGSPTIQNWLPNSKSALLIRNYPTPEDLAHHIKELLANDELYEQYLEHKIKGQVSNKNLPNELHVRSYQTDTLETVKKFECFICDKIYERNAGSTHVYQADKTHYNCPKPESAISSNHENSWLFAWKLAGDKANEIYNKIIGLSK